MLRAVIFDLDNTLTDFMRMKEVSIDAAIEEIRAGKMVILVDDEDRENEGDLIFAAQSIDESKMAMLIRECSGIVCLCLTEDRVGSLGLPMMVENNSSNFRYRIFYSPSRLIATISISMRKTCMSIPTWRHPATSTGRWD